MRYQIHTPIRGIRPDADGTIGADRLGDDAETLVAIGAISAVAGSAGADDDAAPTGDWMFAEAFDDATMVERFLDHFAGRDEPGYEIAGLLIPALTARAWSLLPLQGFALPAPIGPLSPNGLAEVRRLILGLDGRSGDDGEEERSTPPAETPPAETPPAETPPAETPPAETPPAETPPAETPPAETPPAELPEVSDRLTRARLVEIATAEGVDIESDANKAALIHAINCAREGRTA